MCLRVSPAPWRSRLGNVFASRDRQGAGLPNTNADRRPQSLNLWGIEAACLPFGFGISLLCEPWAERRQGDREPAGVVVGCLAAERPAVQEALLP